MITGAIPAKALKKTNNSITIMKEEIYKIIRNSPELREKIALELGIIESSVYGLAKRKSEKLEKFSVVKIIMSHTNKTEEQIFETVS